jgi:Domain of unknown function (DUF1840)
MKQTHKEHAMLYKFKSKNAGDVIMLEPNGRRILEVIGKDAGATGIILPEQMPAAIAAIEAAIALEESHDPKTDDPLHGDAPGLRQRAMPFIDMLKRNHKANTEVVWGT